MLQELFLLLQKNTLTANIYVIYNEIVTIMEMMYKTDSFFKIYITSLIIAAVIISANLLDRINRQWSS